MKNSADILREIQTNAHKANELVLDDTTRQKFNEVFDKWLQENFQLDLYYHKHNNLRSKEPLRVATFFSRKFDMFLAENGIKIILEGTVNWPNYNNQEEKEDIETYIKAEGETILPKSLTFKLKEYFNTSAIPQLTAYIQLQITEKKANVNSRIDQAYKNTKISPIYSLSKSHNIALDQERQIQLIKDVITYIQESYNQAKQDQKNLQHPHSLKKLAQICLDNGLDYPATHASYKTILPKLITIFQSENQSEEVINYQIKRLVKESFSQLFNSPIKSNQDKISKACEKGDIDKLFLITNSTSNTALDQEQFQNLQNTLISKIEEIANNKNFALENKATQYLEVIHYSQANDKVSASLTNIFQLKENLSNKSFIYRAKEFFLEIISQVFHVDQSDKAQFRKHQKEALSEITQNLPLMKQPSSKNR